MSTTSGAAEPANDNGLVTARASVEREKIGGHLVSLPSSSQKSCQDFHQPWGPLTAVLGAGQLHGTTQFRCLCCGLHQTAQYGDDGVPAAICIRCREHSDDTVERLAAREAEHAAMCRRALFDAQDEALLAQGERDHYRDKMQAAYSSRELLVKVLAEIDHLHHRRGRRCSCGRRSCSVEARLADPRVARLVRRYDEVQRTLRELHEANPDRWIDRWDYIDVSVVYPEPRRRSGRGRHRAAG